MSLCFMKRITHLEKINISIGITEAEDVLFLGMLRDRLHNTVFSQNRITR